MTQSNDIHTLFLQGAGTVLGAISDPAVEAAWDRPSVLEEQLVGSLAGHLARGGIWVVADYLRAGAPTGAPDFASAGEYFAAFVAASSAEARKSVRDRAAAVAALGRQEVLRRGRQELTWLETELASSAPGRLVAVIGGKAMGLSDYLATRVVEQAVHLDDLARSIGRDPWPLPPGHQALAISVGTDIAWRLHGPDAILRALYRRGFAEAAFPVL